MSKSNVSSIPGVSAMTDTLEFVKNMWGGMKIPNMVMPTLSVDDINKQITDLKAVESWLTLNMNMLHSTIQALEVQSATISTLKSMGETMTALVKPNGASSFSSSSSSASSSPTSSPAFPFGMGMPGTATSAGKSPDGASTGKTASTGSAGSAAAFSFTPPTTEKPLAPKMESEPEPEAPPQPAVETFGLAAAPFANPAAWWNLLQEQFKHAVNSAIMQESEPKAEQPKTKAKAAPTSGPAPKAAMPKATMPKAKKNGSGSRSRSASGKTSAAGKRKSASKS